MTTMTPDKTLQEYQRVAKRALSEPAESLEDSFPGQMTVSGGKEAHFPEHFRPSIGEAFAQVAQYLATLSPDDPSDRLARDIALGFLARPFTTQRIVTDTGQSVRYIRNDDMDVMAVIILRADEQPLGAQDLRFNYAQYRDLDEQFRRAMAPELGEPVPATPLSKLKGDDRLRVVARLYNEAVKAGCSSTREFIVTEMDVTSAYAGVLVKRARRKGFLPPPTEGNA